MEKILEAGNREAAGFTAPPQGLFLEHVWYSEEETMRDCRGMIFDLDGTLLDSMGVWSQIDVDFLAKRGIDLPEDYQQAVTPMGARQAADYTIERFHLPDTPEMLMEEWLSHGL